MGQPLLNRARRRTAALGISLSALASVWNGCFLDRPLLELDPALRDTTLSALPASEHRPAARTHLLESFGSYGCVSCPDAEARLAPYIHAAAPEAGRPGLVIVNYHVKFGSIADPWVTPAIQAWNDAKGYASLPQAVMDGGNAPYGIREKDVAFKEGEYDSLVVRARRADPDSWLDLRLDTAGIVRDTSAGHIRFRFRALNLDTAALPALDFRVLAVKNRPASIPIYPTPWEVIVVEMTDKDAKGMKLAVAGLPGLTAKDFTLDLAVPSETGKHSKPPPLGAETLADYALVVVAQDRAGRVLNVAAHNYAPE